MNYKRKMEALYQRKVVGTLERKVVNSALYLGGQLKLLTPVLTGAARSNWHMDVGAPSVQIVEAGGDIEPNAQGYTIDKTIFWSNNLPYIKRLDEGYSQQAPAGMTDDAIANTKARAKKL